MIFLVLFFISFAFLQRCVNEIEFNHEARYWFESELFVSHLRMEQNSSFTVVAKHESHSIRRAVALSLLQKHNSTDDVKMLFGLRTLNDNDNNNDNDDDEPPENWPVLFLQNCAGSIESVFSSSSLSSRRRRKRNDNVKQDDDDDSSSSKQLNDGYDHWRSDEFLAQFESRNDALLFRELRSLLTLFSLSTNSLTNNDDTTSSTSSTSIRTTKKIPESGKEKKRNETKNLRHEILRVVKKMSSQQQTRLVQL